MFVIAVRLLSVTAVNCPEGQKACADGAACVPQSDVCDGVQSCADGSDEEHALCGTSLGHFHICFYTHTILVFLRCMYCDDKVCFV